MRSTRTAVFPEPAAADRSSVCPRLSMAACCSFVQAMFVISFIKHLLNHLVCIFPSRRVIRIAGNGDIEPADRPVRAIAARRLLAHEDGMDGNIAVADMAGNIAYLPGRPVEQVAPARFIIERVGRIAQGPVFFQPQVEEIGKALHRRIQLLHDLAVVEVETGQLPFGIVEFLLVFLTDAVFQGYLIIADVTV